MQWNDDIMLVAAADWLRRGICLKVDDIRLNKKKKKKKKENHTAEIVRRTKLTWTVFENSHGY